MAEINTDGGCAMTIGAVCTILQTIVPGARIVLFPSDTQTTIEVECGSSIEASKLRGATFAHLVGVFIALSGSMEHSLRLVLK